MWIISFASFDAHSLPIFAKVNIIKFPDLIFFCNYVNIKKYSNFQKIFLRNVSERSNYFESGTVILYRFIC